MHYKNFVLAIYYFINFRFDKDIGKHHV